MKKKIILGTLIVGTLTGCDMSEKLGTPPQISDVNSVGCLVANDFYAVHFSAYLKPTMPQQGDDRNALLKPYCQELPDIGKAFFAADLIDRDIRKTPIGIRVIEIEKTGSKLSDFKEIRELTHVEPKIYSTGVVEAQVDLDKKGDYTFILLIGGEEAISDEDKLKILFHVGENPFAWLKEKKILISGGMAGLFAFFCGVYFYRKK
ncbi:MAG: hypothetical protein WCI06_03890 [Methylococcaceae bacterium]